MKTRHIFATALTLMVAAGASAQVKPEDAIGYRQSVMNVVGHAFGPMISMAQGKIPYNKDVVVKNSNVLDTIIDLPWTSFAPGTEKGAPTKASMKIWSESEKFKEHADKVQQAAANLAKVAKTGDEKAVKTAIGELGKSCKSCHDDYRLKEARN
ncbi:MAG: cytochrome c [Betaproteobacteria bacterium]|nr:cytochrome c [Betaproteobacteria bacterium]